MKANNFVLGQFGAHRGGRAIHETMTKLGQFPREAVVVDLVGERAEELAESWRKTGVKARSLPGKGEEVISDLPERSRAMLTTDSLDSMVKVIQASGNVPLEWQMLCCTPGDQRRMVMGLAGSLVRQDEQSRVESEILLRGLQGVIPPQSSQAIRRNPMNRVMMQPVRQEMSMHSARRLQLLDREPQDLDGGTLNLLVFRELLPLKVIQATSSPGFRERQQIAKQVDPPIQARAYAVAVVSQEVELFVLERARFSQSIRMYVNFSRDLDSMLSRLLPQRANEQRTRGAVTD